MGFMERLLYRQFFEIEANHWWFVARRRIVLDQLRRALPHRCKHVLDVGCGTGLMLEHLQTFGEVEGVDMSAEAVAFCRQRFGNRILVQEGRFPMSSNDFEHSFDLITVLDVLEHISDDGEVLRNLHGLLVPHGTLFCTVPAFMSLWSGHDVVNQHHRRYLKAELRQRLTEAGFRIQRLTYFNTLLFPLIFVARRATPRRRRMAPRSSFRTHATYVNGLLTSVFGAEQWILRHFDFPVGVSLMCVAQRI